MAGAAAKELESAATDLHRNAVDLTDSDAVRLKVADLTRLAEMKWRYRVVNVGESPLDEALRLLADAKDLLDNHRQVHVAACTTP